MDGNFPNGDAGPPITPGINARPVPPQPIEGVPLTPPVPSTPSSSFPPPPPQSPNPATPTPPPLPEGSRPKTSHGHPAPPLPANLSTQRPIAQATPLRPILVPAKTVASPTQMFDQAAAREEEDAPFDFETQKFLKAAPPWMISLIFHMGMIIFLGLLFFPPNFTNALQLEAVFSDSIGEQLDEFVELSALDSPEMEQAIVVEEDWAEVEDPLAAPPNLDLPVEDLNPVNNFDVPTIGAALQGRDVGMKNALLKAYGGTAETEAAVQLGLEWLKRRQEKTGSWSLVGPYSKGGSTQNRIAATSMALLAFQGAGTTHEKGKYHKTVAKGWRFLLKEQTKDGVFFKRVAASNHRFYTHAQATIAICELYGMTRDPELKEPAQKAIDYLCDMQDQAGGWRYYPKQGSDLSVTGWVLMGLQSGRMAGLIVPSPVFERISRYLDRLEDMGGSRYGYMSGDAFTETMTAEGLLCRQYLGWRQDDPRLESGTQFLVDNPIEWRNANFYYWYYATQVLHHMEGDKWDEWNEILRTEIPNRQEKVGKERGSWYSGSDRFADAGGRLYTTCLSIFMLEVYYRHLPIYSKVYDK